MKKTFQLNRDAQMVSLVLADICEAVHAYSGSYILNGSPVRLPMRIPKLHLEIFHKYIPACNFAKQTIRYILQSETLS